MTEATEYKCFKCKWQYELYKGTMCILCRANSNFTPIFEVDNE